MHFKTCSFLLLSVWFTSEHIDRWGTPVPDCLWDLTQRREKWSTGSPWSHQWIWQQYFIVRWLSVHHAQRKHFCPSHLHSHAEKPSLPLPNPQQQSSVSGMSMGEAGKGQKNKNLFLISKHRSIWDSGCLAWAVQETLALGGSTEAVRPWEKAHYTV